MRAALFNGERSLSRRYGDTVGWIGLREEYWVHR